MTLTTYAALSRFVRRRRRFVPETADRWLPVALRWRRRRRTLRRLVPAARATLVQNVWQPHLHFHSRWRSVEAPTPVAAMPVYSATRELETLMTMIEQRWHRPSPLIGSALRPPAPAQLRWRRSPGARAQFARSTPSPMGRARLSAQVEPLPRSSSSRVDVHTHSFARIRSVERTFATTRTIQRRQEVLMPWHQRQGSTAASVDRSRPARVGPSFRPAEIAWRRSGGPVGSLDRLPLQRSLDASSPSIPHQPALRTVGSDAPASERARPAVLHLSDLDASVVDRLTDDVIRRVERRVRIERERRGM